MNFAPGPRICSYLLKCIVTVSAAAGVFLSALASRETFMGGSRVFMYFTIQSNIAIALICLIGILLLRRGTPAGTVWYTVKFVGTVSITLTGAVFCFVLAPTLGKYAWNVQNVLTHVVVPIAAVADFFVTGIGSEIPKRNNLFVILPPLAYAAWAGYGYAAGWEFGPGINYPYFFLNWGSPAGAFGFSEEPPWMGCAWWILMLFILLLLTGYLYLVISDVIRRRIRAGVNREEDDNV